MTDETIDLTHSLESANGGKINFSQELVVETFGKFDVNFEEIGKEVNILDFEILQTQEKNKNSIFDEFDSISYRIKLVTYNVEFLLRLLTFQNDAQSQILKLDIQTQTTNFKKEFEYCFNSLQRRRNLNLMFKTLIRFSRFVEERRLICDLVLKKNKNIKIEQNKNGGIIIVYNDEIKNVRLGIFWSIACNSTHNITDVIEVYYKFVELTFSNKNEIENKLNLLTEPCLEFIKKYHLWLSLIDNLSGKTLCIVINKMPDILTTKRSPQKIEVTLLSDSAETSDRGNMSDDSTTIVLSPNTNSTKKQEAQNVTVLSDSEESSRKSLVIEGDAIAEDSTKNVLFSSNNNKERKVENVTVLSDSEESSQKSLVIEVDKISEDFTKNILFSPNNNKERKVENVTVLSDSEESSQKSLVIEVDKMPEGLTRKRKEATQVAAIISSSTESCKKYPVVKVAKLQNTSSTTPDIPHSQKNIRKEAGSVVSSENEDPLEDEESLNDNQSLDDKDSSEDEDIQESKGDKDVSRKPQTCTKIFRSSSTSECLKSSDFSYSKTMAKKILKRKKRKEHSSNNKDYTTSEDDKMLSDQLAAKNSRNLEKVRRLYASEFNSSDDDDKDLPKKFLGKERKTPLCPSHRSPCVSSTVEEDYSPVACSALLVPRRSLCTEYKNKPVQSPVVTSTPITTVAIPALSRGSVLVTDHSTLKNSVPPNELLNNNTSKKDVTPSTPTRNRIRIIPDTPGTPGSKTPSYRERNLLTPSKKAKFEPKKIDDDLEITSVTYLVPD